MSKSFYIFHYRAMQFNNVSKFNPFIFFPKRSIELRKYLRIIYSLFFAYLGMFFKIILHNRFHMGCVGS